MINPDLYLVFFNHARIPPAHPGVKLVPDLYSSQDIKTDCAIPSYQCGPCCNGDNITSGIHKSVLLRVPDPLFRSFVLAQALIP